MPSPYIPYDNSGSAGNFGGYCTHSSILFPPWYVRSPLVGRRLIVPCRHRPYLALFEQVLYKHVTDVAASYTDAAKKTQYQAAAQRFRIPYVYPPLSPSTEISQVLGLGSKCRSSRLCLSASDSHHRHSHRPEDDRQSSLPVHLSSCLL